jgi:hypothetical protein
MPWSVADYNTNPTLNGAINGIDIAELSAAAGYNNALRQIMADIKTWVNTQAITLPVAVAQGGTGATAAAGARTNLGALSATYRDLVRNDHGATFTLVDTDGGTGIALTGTTGTVNIDPGGTTAVTIGVAIALHNVASGNWTVTPGVGVTLKKNGAVVSSSATLAPGAVASLVKWASDMWTITGLGVS